MVIRWTLFIENNWNKNIKENNSKFLKRILHYKNNQEDLLSHCTSTEAAVAFFYANHLLLQKLSLTLHTSMKIRFLMKEKNRMK